MNALHKCFRHISIKDVISRAPGSHRYSGVCGSTATTTPRTVHPPREYIHATEKLHPCNKSLIAPLSLCKVSIDLPEHKTNISRAFIDPIQSRIDVSCPRFGSHESDTLILPPVFEGAVFEDPEIQIQIIKHAKNILKIRRRKMNKHKLRKLRRRMKFRYRRLKMKKLKKREKIFRAELAGIRKAGVDFVALEMVKAEIALAKKGGYKLDVFLSRDSEKSL